jgi:predicted regulator of Ras-like GTPase activity (Roadblock/LC7/MglB family)
VSDVLTEAVQRVSHVPGVRGALVVEAEAGLSVVAEVAAETDGDAVAALSAALFRRTAEAAAIGGFGMLESLHLEADGGHVLVAGGPDLVIVVIAEDDAQLGRIRVETLRAAEALR